VVLCGESAIVDASSSANSRLRVELLLLHEEQDEQEARALAAACGSPCVVRGNEAVMRRASGLETVSESCAVAVADMPQPDTSVPMDNVLVLDAVADPGNFGTILRTASAFGWSNVWALPGCCDPFNDKALQAGRGAQFCVNFRSGTWQDLEPILTSEVVAADAKGELVDEFVKRRLHRRAEIGAAESVAPCCLVLGNEGNGLSAASLERAGSTVSIEMTNEMESLNVGVAAGILMYSLRQRQVP